MDAAELTHRIIAASGPPAVDDLTTFLRKRIADDRRVLEAVHAPVINGPQHQVAVGGGTTALVPLGRFAAELDAKERELDRLDHAVRESLAMTGAEPAVKVMFQTRVDYALNTARSMALPYATHPDYKESWRP